jgi:hypothetical protein
MNALKLAAIGVEAASWALQPRSPGAWSPAQAIFLSPAQSSLQQRRSSYAACHS